MDPDEHADLQRQVNELTQQLQIIQQKVLQLQQQLNSIQIRLPTQACFRKLPVRLHSLILRC